MEEDASAAQLCLTVSYQDRLSNSVSGNKCSPAEEFLLQSENFQLKQIVGTQKFMFKKRRIYVNIWLPDLSGQKLSFHWQKPVQSLEI